MGWSRRTAGVDPVGRRSRGPTGRPLGWVVLGWVVPGWVVLGALVVLVALERGALDLSQGWARTVVYTVVPILAIAVAAADAARRGRWIAVGALVIALSPGVLASVGAAERHGALAALAACGGLFVAVPPDRRHGRAIATAVAAGAVLASIAATVLWWRSGFSRGRAPGPGWQEIVNSTGDAVRSALATLGPGDVPSPPTTQLLWWCAVGLLVGAALVAGRRVAGVVPCALAAFVLVTWAIMLWRGPVDAGGGAWLISAAVAATGARADLPPAADRSVGRALVILGGAAWATGSVRLLRSTDASPPSSVAAVIAIAVVVAVVWDRSSRPADEDGEVGGFVRRVGGG